MSVAALAAPVTLSGLASGTPGRHPVVVELFTSQGCSTCPPADRLLARLAQDSGGGVVPLAFHVDSWNHDGWTDPFSSAAWTRRQASYARALRAAGTYTPQAVVDGAVELVGSDATGLTAAIAAAAARPAGEIRLEVARDPERIRASIAVVLPPALRDRKLDLLLAVYETGLETPVGRGENSGKMLHDDYVVRSLTRVARLPAADGLGSGNSLHETALRLAKSWVRSRLGVAAFLQDPRTLAIHGAQAQELERYD